jgi:hypothetical protein
MLYPHAQSGLIFLFQAGDAPYEPWPVRCTSLSVGDHFMSRIAVPVNGAARLGKLVMFRSSNAAFYLRPLPAEKRAFCNDALLPSDSCNLPKTRLFKPYTFTLMEAGHVASIPARI